MKPIHLWPKTPVKKIKTLRVKFEKGETFQTATNQPISVMDVIDRKVILHGKGFRLCM